MSPTTIPLYKQPAFDNRIRSLTRPFGSGTTPLQRGFMLWDTSQTFPAGYSKANGPAYILFLFNPSTISASYEMASSGAQAAVNFPVASDPAQLIVPLAQSISFSLYFDRTYEMNTQGATNQIQDLGVDVDVIAIRQFTGMYAQEYTSNLVSGAVGQTNPGLNAKGGLSQGIMQLTLGYLYFSGPGTALSFYGFINSWDVTYTHFNQNMIPMRCVADISWNLLPPPNAPQPTAAAALQISQLGGNYPGVGTGTTSPALTPLNGVGGR
jgi:hypothetical protein